jgi:outer membrane protein
MLKPISHIACITLLFTSTSFTAPSVARADAFQDALASAYKTNPRIKAQRRTAEQSNERVSQAIGGFRPTISATYQRGKQQTSFDGSDKETNNLDNRTLSLEQPIFLGGRNFHNFDASKDRAKANWAGVIAIEQEVLLDSAIAYMDVVQNYALIELSENNVSVLEQQLAASQDRFSVGDVTRTDVAQSQARLAQAKADMIEAKGTFEVSLAEFERVMAFRPQNLPLPLPQHIPPLPKTIAEGIEQALANNPNIKASSFSRKAAQSDVGIATSTLLPQISLQGRISRQDGAGVLGNSEFNSDQLLLNVDIPLYQNGSEYSQRREAELTAKQREHELKDTQDSIREALVQAWESHEAALATIIAQEEQVEAAEIALDGVRQENQYGSRTVLEVLDAEQELFVARVNLVRANRSRYVSLYSLLAVLGELTTEKLSLNVDRYDPKEHYDSVKWQLIGF